MADGKHRKSLISQRIVRFYLLCRINIFVTTFLF